jgi:hypothetical protein
MPPSSDDLRDWRAFEIEQAGTSGGHCDCCGTNTKRIWGYVQHRGALVAAYFVAWTEGKPDHGAAFDLILGKWGESATKKDRYSVALDFRVIEDSPQFMVVDAKNRVTSGSPLVGTALVRSDVIGTTLAPQIFAILDAVYMTPELDELRSWSGR